MGAAIAAAIYARRAAIATEETVEIAKTTTAETVNSIQIAQTNANAAVKLSDQSEQTANHQLRACLHVQSIAYDDCWQSEEKEQLRFVFANHGVTPATLKSLDFEAYWRNPDGGRQAMMNYKSNVSVECFNKLPVNLSIDLNYSEIPEEEGCLCVSGNINYDTVFGDSFNTAFEFRTDFFANFNDIDSVMQMMFVVYSN